MGADLVNCLIADIAAKTKNALVGGPFGSNLVSKDYVVSGIPVIRGQNMGHGRWVMGDFVFVAPQKANELSANTARPGDLVFTQRGTLGQVAIVPEGPYDKYIISQSQMKLTVDHSKADTLFLYYLFCTPEQQDYIKTNSIQVGVPHTNLGILRGTPISLPPIEDQHAIAKILSSIDDKIELNRQINQTLEQIAQTIFKSWFVDFEPVKAKIEAKAAGRDPERAAMCAISGRLEPELDQLRPEHYQQLAATAALFPDELVESELGLIPVGWEVKGLDHLAALSTKSVSPSSLPDAVFEHYSIPAYDATFQPVFELGDSIKSNKYQVDSSAVLVSKLNPETPRIWLPNVKTTRPVCSTEFMQFVPREKDDRSYLFLLMKSEPMQSEILQRVTGSTGSRQRAQPSQIAVLPIVLPKRNVRSAFFHLVTPLLEQMTNNLDQTEGLATLRDTLLPKLLSGELAPNVVETETADTI